MGSCFLDEASFQRAAELRCRGGAGSSGRGEPLLESSAGGGQERRHPPGQREGRAEPAAGGARPGEGGPEEEQKRPGGAEEAAGPSGREAEQGGARARGSSIGLLDEKLPSPSLLFLLLPLADGGDDGGFSSVGGQPAVAARRVQGAIEEGPAGGAEEQQGPTL